MRLAYLLSHYPRASQVFLQRELAGLRELGVEVQAVSIRRSRDLHSAADREEAERTEWLTPARPVRLLRAHGRAALRHPAAWLGSLAWAWREAPPGGRLQQVRYWGGAVVLWE